MEEAASQNTPLITSSEELIRITQQGGDPQDLFLVPRSVLRSNTSTIEHQARQLGNQLEMVSLIFAAVGTPIIFYDADWNVAWANSPAQQWFQPSDIIGKNFREITSSPDSLIRFEAAFNEVRETRKPLAYEFYEPEKSIWMRASYAPVFNNNGGFMGAVAWGENITARKNAEQLNIELQDRVARLEMLTDISHHIHDLGNVFTSVVCNIDLLRYYLSNYPESQVHKILDELGVLLPHIKGTLQYLREDMRKNILHPRNVAVDEIIQELQTFLSHNERTIGIQVTYNTDTETKNVTLKIDTVLLQNALHNFIINAADAIRDNANTGNVEVTCRNTEKYITITIRDTGPGMPANVVYRLLNGESITTKATGTGQGVQGATRNIKAMGGEVVISSTPGAGTEVQVLLPKVSL